MFFFFHTAWCRCSERLKQPQSGLWIASGRDLITLVVAPLGVLWIAPKHSWSRPPYDVETSCSSPWLISSEPFLWLPEFSMFATGTVPWNPCTLPPLVGTRIPSPSGGTHPWVVGDWLVNFHWSFPSSPPMVLSIPVWWLDWSHWTKVPSQGAGVLSWLSLLGESNVPWHLLASAKRWQLLTGLFMLMLASHFLPAL